MNVVSFTCERICVCFFFFSWLPEGKERAEVCACNQNHPVRSKENTLNDIEGENQAM